MQHIADITQIKRRAAAIGLKMNDVAARAGVPPSTAHAKTRDGRDRDVRSSTLAKLSEAVIGRELELRDYLIGLHGVPGNGSGSVPIPAEGGAE